MQVGIVCHPCSVFPGTPSWGIYESPFISLLYIISYFSCHSRHVESLFDEGQAGCCQYRFSEAESSSNNLQLCEVSLCVNLMSLVASTIRLETWSLFLAPYYCSVDPDDEVCVCLSLLHWAVREGWGVSQLALLTPSLKALTSSSVSHCFHKYCFCFWFLFGYIERVHSPYLRVYMWRNKLFPSN